MFHTFTGSSRRPRQVNLSGRNNNPFALVQQQTTTPGQPSSAVQHAQQERKARQLERERLQASKVIQTAWKDYRTRKRKHEEQREEWDQLIQGDHKDLNTIFRLLLQFARPRQEGDFRRVLKACQLLLDSRPAGGLSINQAALAEKLIQTLNVILELETVDSASARTVILTLQYTSTTNPDQVAQLSTTLFKAIAKLLTVTNDPASSLSVSAYEILTNVLQRSTSRKIQAHEGLVELFSTWLQNALDLDRLAPAVDAESLALAQQHYLKTYEAKDNEKTYWMLAKYIYLYRTASQVTSKKSATSGKSNVNKAWELDGKDSKAKIAHIGSLTRLMSTMSRKEDFDTAINDEATTQSGVHLKSFVQSQLESLIDQDTISSLLTCLEGVDYTNSDYASTLASYVLTLIQIFPRRSDEIRMWIYMGSASTIVNRRTERLPAIKFFWQAVQQTSVFKQISQDSNGAIKLLSPQKRVTLSKPMQSSLEQEWKICLLFFELYTFVLKIMDDDEFMSAGESETGYRSWTRQSALQLDQVRDLTVFLKNLAFAMYWNAADITVNDIAIQRASLQQYFSTNLQSTHPRSHDDPLVVRGLQSSALSYIKGTVTGLLRMLYERDSRRKFFPEGHWLMSQVEMAGFIQAVLEEQRHKDEQIDQDTDEDEDEDPMDVDEVTEDRDLLSLVGAQRTQYLRRVEQIRKQQHRAMKRRRLEDALPRLNILENMPFFIPFHTRVQIFRQFVRADQQLRRNGHLDPDQWRMSVIHGDNGRESRERAERVLQSRSARVRRDHVMDDAFSQLYGLGEGLKEPIQITFVDQFDTPEAGIDGGGVTKEFLTSVTEEAFKKGELRLFKENSQHLLYPNPALLEEEKVILRQAEVSEGSGEWQAHLREILLRYEFIGRIVGKCLYEGILIDVHFAPFFLVKWALTGGRGSATNESAYRATINDLKALDEELYKGLLDVKNYSGNAEDFSLDFTITDEISTEDDPLGSIKITKELRPDGANIPVTNENKLVYISYVARHRLQIQPHQQTNAFLRGLGTMIQPAWLSMFNQSELQTLIGGDSSEIDVGDLRNNTYYGGVYQIGDDGQEHPTVKLFWDVVQELSDGNRRKFLKYVTSTPRAPLLGFSQLRPPFSIRDSGSDQQRLPSTSTCVNLLKLPIYKNKEVLRDKLLYAITSGAGFDLS